MILMLRTLYMSPERLPVSQSLTVQDFRVRVAADRPDAWKMAAAHEGFRAKTRLGTYDALLERHKMRTDSWGIAIPGLTCDKAIEIREKLLPDSRYGVVLLDPKKFMIDGFDRSTVEVMIKCMQAGLAAGTLGPEESSGVRSLLEDYQDWLEFADPPSE
jgi:hypothetical protein